MHARTDGTPTTKVRCNLTLSHDLHESMIAIAREAGCDMGDLLRQGLAILQVARNAKAQGMSFGICNRDGVLDTEIVGLL